MSDLNHCAACEAKVSDWILRDARRMRRTRAFFGGLCEKLNEAGLPVARAVLSMRTLHPNVAATTYLWQRNAWCSEEVDRGHGILDSDKYLKSPMYRVHQTGKIVRCRIEPGPGPREFPVLDELADEGMTDYIAMPIRFSTDQINVMTFATDKDQGFSDAEIAMLERLADLSATMLEVQSIRRIAVSLLDTYVGHATGERIMDGQIQRGEVEEVEAAIWISDLRDFTPLADRLPGSEVVELLDDYFDCMATAITAHGGEVLKFIGDSMLAIMPISDRDDCASVCRDMQAAARDAAEAVAAKNAERVAAGKAPIVYGMALHMGRVLYGNIGSADRLDFTVIGPAVNHAARLEGQCRALGRTVLVSEAVALNDGEGLEDLGVHKLRGVAEPHRIYSLPVCLDKVASGFGLAAASRAMPGD
ncbi:MAG: adenylate/guanylate cyclase domain-containing protein [Alphaproteobacteria bacterium]|nr:adenylate/guanylate cyclase domain-containing protein [Alphaproteobacteria bacterium]